jgi:hypothetical protein
VSKELEKHLAFDYLKAEFTAIRRKLQASPEDEKLILALTDKNLSLDKVISRICVPVLLTYNSAVMGAADRVTEEFTTALTQEVDIIYEKFKSKLPFLSLRVHLCLLPLGDKAKLTAKFHEVLMACQVLN